MEVGEFAPLIELNKVTALITRLEGKGLKKLLGKVENLTKLKTLHVYDQLDKELTDALLELLPRSHITTLIMNSLKICSDSLILLCKGLESSKVTNLDLSSNRIGDVGIIALAHILAGTFVSLLQLSSNEFGSKGVQALAHGIVGSRLRVLDITFNEFGKEDLQGLFKDLRQCNLTTFKCSSILGQQTMDYLYENVEHSQLTSLRLPIRPEYAKPLLEAISKSNVTELFILSNDSNACCIIISDNIQYFRLVGFGISDTVNTMGLERLMSALTKTNLKQLDLRGNHLDYEGMKVICKYLPLTKISKLDINYGDVGKCGSDLLSSILQNTAIKWDE
ncbi:hypothetical protein HDV01_000486 [Terramyces sp. JEL0728]|nr:hypothetical protein HDV01_000486 [Terramyces sp. JEL0728]